MSVELIDPSLITSELSSTIFLSLFTIEVSFELSFLALAVLLISRDAEIFAPFPEAFVKECTLRFEIVLLESTVVF